MAKKGYKSKIVGGMSPTWISDIRKNPNTSRAISTGVNNAIKQANAAMKVRYPLADFFSWFYKEVKLKGKWGTTHIVVATTPMSKKRKEVLDSALLKNGFKRK